MSWSTDEVELEVVWLRLSQVWAARVLAADYRINGWTSAAAFSCSRGGSLELSRFRGHRIVLAEESIVVHASPVRA